MGRISLLLAALFGGALVASACDGTTPTASDDPPENDAGGDAGEDAAPACEATGNGTIALNITGVPEGLGGSVFVDGAEAIPATTMLATAAGRHSISAGVITKSGSIVRSAYFATIDNASPCVVDGQTATVNITYAKIPTSDALWATHANAAGDFIGFPSGSLGATATATPIVVTGGLTKAGGVAFDKVGNLWVVDGSSIKRFPASSFGATGDATASITLSGDAFNEGVPGPSGIAFDASGNLWVSLVAAKKIVEIPAANLSTTGAVEPSIVLSGDALDGVGAIAFDKTGNLYAATAAHVVRYSSSQIAASTAAAPDLSLEGKTPEPAVGTLTTPSSIAFEGDGGLWVGYFAGNVIAHYTAAELAANGAQSLTPAIQITTDVTAILEGIAFDESKSMWLTFKSGQVARYSTAQLAESGTKVPETILTGTGVGSTASVTFFPAPADLPLFHALP